MVVCCLCGVAIQPNDAMMCLPCLRLEVAQETQGSLDSIEREIVQCPKCLEWKRDNVSQNYFAAEWESVQLLTHLTKRLRRLKNLQVVDAKFVWTEPHSKRIKVHIIYEQEVLDRTKVQQSVELEFRIRDNLCRSCSKNSNKDGWSSMVQIRQHADTVGVLLRLEHDIQEVGLHLPASQIGSTGSGLDMTFNEDKHANDLVRFVRGRVPCIYQQTRKVVSTDVKSGNHNIKHTHLLTVAPINAHDLVVLPAKLALAVGGVGRLALCIAVTNQFTFVDVGSSTFHQFVVTAAQYFRDPFVAVLQKQQLTEFMVLDFSFIRNVAAGAAGSASQTGSVAVATGGRGKGSKKKRERRRKAKLAAMERAGVDTLARPEDSTADSLGHPSPPLPAAAAAATETAPERVLHLADAEVSRLEDLGDNDLTFRVRTHVGDKLSVGEVIYGYNLESKLSMIGEQLGLNEGDLPSVVLVKGEDPPDPKKRKNRRYRGKKENFNGGRPVVRENASTVQNEQVPQQSEGIGTEGIAGSDVQDHGATVSSDQDTHEAE